MSGVLCLPEKKNAKTAQNKRSIPKRSLSALIITGTTAVSLPAPPIQADGSFAPDKKSECQKPWGQPPQSQGPGRRASRNLCTGLQKASRSKCPFHPQHTVFLLVLIPQRHSSEVEQPLHNGVAGSSCERGVLEATPSGDITHLPLTQGESKDATYQTSKPWSRVSNTFEVLSLYLLTSSHSPGSFRAV